jgi:hypothetical protein
MHDYCWSCGKNCGQKFCDKKCEDRFESKRFSVMQQKYDSRNDLTIKIDDLFDDFQSRLQDALDVERAI